jgi:hypothetical protein
MFDQKLNRFSFDREKALEVLLYISSQIPDMYKTLKILYFADIEHLSKYGRFINGDTYIAMRHGPVPSQSYDIIKGIRGDSLNSATSLETSSLAIENNILIPKRAPNLSLFSKSDIKSLDYSINTHKNHTFSELHKDSSDSAYNSTSLNDEISVFEIAKTLPNSEKIINYLEKKYS